MMMQKARIASLTAAILLEPGRGVNSGSPPLWVRGFTRFAGLRGSSNGSACLSQRRTMTSLARPLLKGFAVSRKNCRRFCQGALSGAAVITLIALAPGLVGASLFPPVESELRPGPSTWRRIPAVIDGLAVLQAESGGTGFWLGDARGVRRVGSEGVAQRTFHRGPVHDLALAPEAWQRSGGVLAATDDGLHRIEPGRDSQRFTALPGRVHRLAVAGRVVIAATDAGLIVSSDGVGWRSLATALPKAPATAVALRLRGDGLECLAVVEGRVWRVGLQADGQTWKAVATARQIVPRRASDEVPVDVHLPGPESEGLEVVVYSDSFAVRSPGATAGSNPWRRLDPGLPPGLSIRRLERILDGWWIATDRGLFFAADLKGPWQRAASPLGGADVSALAAVAGSLYAVGAGGLWKQELREKGVAPARGSEAARIRIGWENDPPIEQVQRVALEFLELEGRWVDDMRAGVRRRGWLPRVTLRAGLERERESNVDFDQSFSSGAVRYLVDRDRGQSDDFDLSLSFTWDLADLAYHPEQVDVSVEARQLLKLRDDVLDELNQLYFERQRVLVELSARSDRSAAERIQLRLRAAELAAGIDAWTGGWFSRSR